MIEQIFHNLDRRCDKFEHYFPLYERHFSRFVGQAPRILEVGVQYGGSAEMWRKYFGDGTTIWGVDIEPRCVETDYLEIVVGDQGDPEFWKSRFAMMQAGFDLIIDDGSHDNPHQITTLAMTYGLLKDGGVYWCEDVHTSYYHQVRVRDGGYRNPRSFVEHAKSIIDVINAPHTHEAIGVGVTPQGPHVPQDLVQRYDSAQGIHFYDSIVVIEKGPRLPFQRTIHG